MKNIKNTFILVIILLIVAVILFQVYIAYSHNSTDTNSYLELLQGQGTLNESFIDREEKYVVVAGDEIRVIGENGLAVIEWGDGSITRLGGNTKIKVEQNSISRDKTQINISFVLLAGKTWSNIISFIGPSSQFTQTFEWLEAWVRGTVFNVDLDEAFVQVTNHEVTLTDTTSGETYRVGEEDPFNITDKVFMDLTDFIAYFQDTSWKELNETFDSEYLNELKSEVQSSIDKSNPFLLLMEKIFPSYRILYELDTTDDYATVKELIDKMSQKTREKSYTRVYEDYQQMNFISASDGAMFERKLRYKKALLDLSETVEEKQNILLSTAYDMQDMISSGNTEYLPQAFSVLRENADIVKNLDVSFLAGGLEYIPTGLLEQMQENLGGLGEIFGESFDVESLKNIDPSKAKDLLNGADEGIQNFLQNQFGDTINNFKK